MNLKLLREIKKVTQIQLAEKLETTQSIISRHESNRDVKVSTVKDYVKALGGEIEIIARFENGSSYNLF